MDNALNGRVLVSGFGKIIILDKVGDPARPVGRYIALAILIEFLLFCLICTAFLALLQTASTLKLMLIVCVSEIPAGVLINWLVLTKSAKPKLAFWVPYVLSMTFPLAVLLASVSVGSTIFEFFGG